jgi:hypothetical protein
MFGEPNDGTQTEKQPASPIARVPACGSLYYVEPGTEKWILLAEGLRTWAQIVEGSERTDTLANLWARYELEVLSKKAEKTRRNRRQEWRELDRVFGRVNATDLKPHHVWRYFRDRGETEGARHEVRCLSALRGAFRVAFSGAVAMAGTVAIGALFDVRAV